MELNRVEWNSTECGQDISVRGDNKCVSLHKWLFSFSLLIPLYCNPAIPALALCKQASSPGGS